LTLYKRHQLFLECSKLDLCGPFDVDDSLDSIMTNFRQILYNRWMENLFQFPRDLRLFKSHLFWRFANVPKNFDRYCIHPSNSVVLYLLIYSFLK